MTSSRASSRVPSSARAGAFPANRPEKATPAGSAGNFCTCGHPLLVHRAADGPCAVARCRCKRVSITPKRQKYNAVRCVGPLGELYDSKAERDYAADLGIQLATSTIAGWSWAPRFVLQDEPLITYRPDFVVWGHGYQLHVVDVKGHAARDFSLRVRLWKARYPDVPLCVVKNGVEDWQ